MTQSLIPHGSKPRLPMRTMEVGDSFSRTFEWHKRRDEFRSRVRKLGRQIERQFTFKNDGLTLTVTRIG